MTPVDAHSGRCLLAPFAASASQRSLAKAFSKTSYASRALAIAALLFSALASSVPIASSRLSTSVSTRETKNEATEWIWDRSWPLAAACSSPVR